MQIPFYQIDAFASRIFSGNPAGVCFIDQWLDDATLQSIAAENNLSETAFVVKQAGTYRLRWFTPELEIDLCGHATLATAHALFRYREPNLRRVDFETRSGVLSVEQIEELLVMEFPSRTPVPCMPPDSIGTVMGLAPSHTYRSRDLMLVYETEDQVRNMKPDLAGIAALDCFAVIVTAPGRSCDFVSRFFAPAAGIPEDAVTGSAHCTLIPYWSDRLGKKKMHAFQVSKRGGELFCEHRGDRVAIGGRAVTYLSGIVTV